MKSKEQLAKDIRKYLREYFINDKFFNKLEDNDKLYVYSLYNRLLHIIYLQLKHPGVLPILFVHHPSTKEIIDRIFDKISIHIPFVEDISVVVIQ
jgi:hypothetical protein|tara:strand:- start:337 stop:621 length:285 start_codon:yes stop_codon:yes gene_type:complete